MRLLLWAVGSIFAAIGIVQIVIEGMLAAFAGSWTRIISLGRIWETFTGGTTSGWPEWIASMPLWLPAFILAAVFLFLGRFRRPVPKY